MQKKTRFIILLVVLALCLWFLKPSINWYFRTPKDVQAIALKSLEDIRDYSTTKAKEDVSVLRNLKSDENAELPENLSWIKSKAEKEYKKAEKTIPEHMGASAVYYAFCDSDGDERVLEEVIQENYRKPLLKAKNYYQNSVKLGLDLSGGMNIIVKADLDASYDAHLASGGTESETEFKKKAMEQALETLTSRIDKFGLSEPVVRQQGDDRIYIEMPGAAETGSINSIIMGKGILPFRIVDDEATAKFRASYIEKGENLFDSNGKLVDSSLIPEDCEVLGNYTKDKYGLDEKIIGEEYIVVKKEAVLDGKHIKSAKASSDNMTGRPEVIIAFDDEGSRIFGQVTGQNVGKRLAIVSDNKIKSAAVIREAITGGSCSLSGFGQEEAINIQKVLQTAWLSVPLSIESQQVIGATLGEQAIRQGLKAIAFGLLAIMIFMLIFYKGAGINAVVAQVLNIYIMFSILSAFNLTLTLPSIAGMILTIGMAVDANVIIFERIKEELLLGKSRAVAISTGFQNAFWAIMDSNITTFIAAIFLSQLGTGSIQGFAVTLAIGVVSSVFTALFVSRLMFDFNTETVHKKYMSISWRVK